MSSLSSTLSSIPEYAETNPEQFDMITHFLSSMSSEPKWILALMTWLSYIS